MASYIIPGMVILVSAAYFHISVQYKLAPTVIDSYCYKFIGLFILFFLCIIPPSLICLRQHRRRVMLVNHVRISQRDNQLLKMLFMYVTLNIISTIPSAVTYVMLIFQQPSYVPTSQVKGSDGLLVSGFNRTYWWALTGP